MKTINTILTAGFLLASSGAQATHNDTPLTAEEKETVAMVGRFEACATPKLNEAILRKVEEYINKNNEPPKDGAKDVEAKISIPMKLLVQWHKELKPGIDEQCFKDLGIDFEKEHPKVIKLLGAHGPNVLPVPTNK